MFQVNELASSYAAALEGLAQPPTIQDVWISVGKSDRCQGWKLHLSSIPVESGCLLQTVVPILIEADVPFKCAKSPRVLVELNSGVLGASQVGKFLTIYPDSDEQAVELAASLSDVTRGFHGPEIPTDLRLGDILYVRYGAFNPVIGFDRLGQKQSLIYRKDGTMYPDLRYIPYTPPSDVVCPFADVAAQTCESNSEFVESPERSDKVIGPGYLPLQVLRSSSKGNVFLALDVRSQAQVSPKVIKQGRRHHASDEIGRDMRSRLQHQAKLHTHLSHLDIIPSADPYFEHHGDGYLPVQYIAGQSLEAFVSLALNSRSWRCISEQTRQQLVSLLLQVVQAVDRLHCSGCIHRDLTVSNIWVGEDSRVYILDFEISHLLEDVSEPYELGTPGFMSPQQAAKHAPSVQDDIFAVGCIMIFVLTGYDPRRILHLLDNYDALRMADRLKDLTCGVGRELLEVISRCVSHQSEQRPTLDEIQRALKAQIDAHPIHLPDQKRLSMESVSTFIQRGIWGLFESSARDSETGLWLSPVVASDNETGFHRDRAEYELKRNAHRGVAGVLYVLARLAQSGYDVQPDETSVARVVDWLLTEDPPPQLPGLFFGDAGVAVALAEAANAHLIALTPQLKTKLRTLLHGILDWPDVTHGAAGQGIAALYCADALHEPGFLEFSHRCAHYLISQQGSDGSWRMPAGVPGMEDDVYSGFAHGIAGIVYFLCEYAHRFDDKNAADAFWAGANWLIEHRIEDHELQSWTWQYSEKDPNTRWRWWCHGSPGIALTFLKLYEHTQQTTFADIVRHALNIHTDDVLYGNLSICHGVCGLGEIYLEAFRVLKEPVWYARAEAIARTLLALRVEVDDTLIWLPENLNLPTADLMVGSSGILHFLLRFTLAGDHVGFPLLLNPRRR